METSSINRTTIAKQWWSSKRIKYNKGLVIAGIVGFLLYCTLGPIFIAPHAVEFEETIFDIAFQGVAYLIMMVIANVFYTAGSLIDISFNKNNSQRFRERLFALGYWFSVALPSVFILGIMLHFFLMPPGQMEK
ncbi:hypothetical protein HDF18_14700 [Mucilaginibacter sp. X5P1]|uniref:hypothetical protein n=1 Tax=Mucilaginibacter sp. X5P1 TaxID=2723088 RepID=UPI0016121164|nr:hypothetical protein [Mucilaginibacter sp. X5P1]MBB6138857.1 hypothetical protein [Mucilaginibacter sp. X5P1]